MFYQKKFYAYIFDYCCVSIFFCFEYLINEQCCFTVFSVYFLNYFEVSKQIKILENCEKKKKKKDIYSTEIFEISSFNHIIFIYLLITK